jgi:tRNA 2-thiocytidine biosynthesis protein TtcA
VKGNLLNALGKVVPTHLLDRRLLARLGEGRGPDPWMDAEEGEACSGEGGGDLPVTRPRIPQQG